ncbi:hypothetical protein AB0H43_13665 [Hamadaea sp. NPDC050747]|uniref:hypothetical protein n=1 Tax=Hamadaea sp. NPDC050747 TaxID=3155789 RepID=UPI0033DD1E4B
MPELARYPLETIRGCLDAAIDEMTVTPILSCADASYLVTPAFALAVTDPAATDEHGTVLFRSVGVHQVQAMLGLRFLTPRAALTWLSDDEPAVAHHAVHRAVKAAHAVGIALLAGGESDLRLLLPGLSELVTAAADSLAVLGPYCGDHVPLAEQGADSIGNLLRVAGQQLLDLRDLCVAHPVDGHALPQLTSVTVTEGASGVIAVGEFRTGNPGSEPDGLLTTGGHPSITEAVKDLAATAARCNLILDDAELSVPDRTPDHETELAAAAAAHRLRWKP